MPSERVAGAECGKLSATFSSMVDNDAQGPRNRSEPKAHVCVRTGGKSLGIEYSKHDGRMPTRMKRKNLGAHGISGGIVRVLLLDSRGGGGHVFRNHLQQSVRRERARIRGLTIHIKARRPEGFIVADGDVKEAAAAGGGGGVAVGVPREAVRAIDERGREPRVGAHDIIALAHVEGQTTAQKKLL